MTPRRIGTAVLIGQFEPGSIPWHKARAKGLGGSEIAAAMGLSPFESPFSLWHRKAGNVGPVEETPEMHWGKMLEPAVAAEFLARHPEFSDEGVTGTFHHVDRAWQIANPDRLLFRLLNGGDVDFECPLEIKTSPFGDNWGDDGTDEVPPHVRCQSIHYGDVFGAYRAHVACLIGGHDYREYLLTWDEAEAELLRVRGRQFLDTLAAGEQPDIDEHSATYQALRELHPDIDPVDAHIGEDLARQYCAARTGLAQADFEHAIARAEVAAAMGTAHRAVWNGHTIATRQARGDGVPFVVAGRNLPTFAAAAA
jgi:putative phage-type endonuclease